MSSETVADTPMSRLRSALADLLGVAEDDRDVAAVAAALDATAREAGAQAAASLRPVVRLPRDAPTAPTPLDGPAGGTLAPGTYVAQEAIWPGHAASPTDPVVQWALSYDVTGMPVATFPGIVVAQVYEGGTLDPGDFLPRDGSLPMTGALTVAVGDVRLDDGNVTVTPGGTGGVFVGGNADGSGMSSVTGNAGTLTLTAGDLAQITTFGTVSIVGQTAFGLWTPSGQISLGNSEFFMGDAPGNRIVMDGGSQFGGWSISNTNATAVISAHRADGIIVVTGTLQTTGPLAASTLTGDAITLTGALTADEVAANGVAAANIAATGDVVAQGAMAALSFACTGGYPLMNVQGGNYVFTFYPGVDFTYGSASGLLAYAWAGVNKFWVDEAGDVFATGTFYPNSAAVALDATDRAKPDPLDGCATLRDVQDAMTGVLEAMDTLRSEVAGLQGKPF